MFLQTNDFSSPIDFSEPIQFHVNASSFIDFNIENINPNKSIIRNDTFNVTISHRPKASLPFLEESIKPPVLPLSKNHIKKQKSSPTPLIQPLLTVSDNEFITLCNDKDVRFNPKSLGFIPYSYWNDEEVTFGDLVRNYFRRRNDPNCHFYQKLYNALLISSDDPFYAEFLGVEWITDYVIRVDETVFSRLFGFKHKDSSLFHRQSFFSTYGFVEVSPSEAASLVSQLGLAGIDFDHSHLLTHKDNVFTKICNVSALDEYARKRFKRL